MNQYTKWSQQYDGFIEHREAVVLCCKAATDSIGMTSIKNQRNQFDMNFIESESLFVLQDFLFSSIF